MKAIFEKNDNCVRNFYEYLKEKRSNEIKNEKQRVERLKRAIKSWIMNEIDKETISVEIKSLIKLKEGLNEDLNVFLLCSDTILSKLAGEIIKEISSNYFVDKFNIKEIKVIEGLQIKDSKQFNRGMSNLIREIYSIAEDCWDNIIINITSGNKAISPFLTILAQINKCLIYYIFENVEVLIKIPNIPFVEVWFDWKEIEKYEDQFRILEIGVTEKDEYHKLLNSDFYQKYSFLIWTEEPFAEFNPIGKIIFSKYNEQVSRTKQPKEN